MYKYLMELALYGDRPPVSGRHHIVLKSGQRNVNPSINHQSAANPSILDQSATELCTLLNPRPTGQSDATQRHQSYANPTIPRPTRQSIANHVSSLVNTRTNILQILTHCTIMSTIGTVNANHRQSGTNRLPTHTDDVQIPEETSTIRIPPLV